MKAETLLLRQVHPTFIKDDEPTSQTFRPTPKDEFKLSVYDGDQIEPEPSWLHYTMQLMLKSIGVVAVTVAECDNESLTVQPDPEPFPEHVTIDFTGLSTKQRKDTAELLRDLAVARGWLYQPDSIP